MIYFLFFLSSLLTANILQRYLNNKFLICFLSLLFFLFLYSFQKGVGTDYESYFYIFSEKHVADFYLEKKEYLFWIISNFVIENKLNPQFGFFLIGLINTISISYFIKNSPIKNIALGIFIFITFSSFFFNSLNLLRQMTAVSLVSISLFALHKSRYLLFITLSIIAAGFHNSAIIASFALIISYIIFHNKKKFTAYTNNLILLLSAILPIFYESDNIITFLSGELAFYSEYNQSHFIGEEKSFSNYITKIIYIPLLIQINIWSIKNYEKKYMQIINICILFFSAKLFFINSSLGQRLGTFSDLLIIYPFLTYFNHFRIRSFKELIILSNIIPASTLLLSSIFLAIKIASSNGTEYDYSSVLNLI